MMNLVIIIIIIICYDIIDILDYWYNIILLIISFLLLYEDTYLQAQLLFFFIYSWRTKTDC